MAVRDPKMSLIVCTLGRRKELERMLETFARQTMTDFEVIIVDQNPHGYLDGVIEPFKKELDIRWIRTDRGLSRARNIGLRQARGAIVGFPDDDCWYDSKVCQYVVDCFASNPGLQFLSGRTVDRGGKLSVSEFRAWAGEIRRRDAFRSGNSTTFFLDRDAALSVGGFDEKMGLGALDGPQSGEETDLMIRFIDRGLRTYYDPALTVFHDQVGQERSERTLRRAKEYSIGFGHIIRKHRFGHLYLTYRLARSVARAAIYVAMFDFWNARVRLLWASGTLRGFLGQRAVPAAKDVPILATNS